MILKILSIFCLFVSSYSWSSFQDYGFFKPSSSSNSSFYSQKESLIGSSLATEEEHKAFLLDTIRTAKKSLMLSSYSISAKDLKNGIGEALIQAARRGVRVHVWYGKEFSPNNSDYEYISKVASFCKKFEQIENHSKVLVKDEEVFTIGSQDWLSFFPGSLNRSLTVQGNVTSHLTVDFLQAVDLYHCFKAGDAKGISSVEHIRNNISNCSHEYEKNQFFYTLSTPDTHFKIMDQAFNTAQKRIVLVSPFIRLANLQDRINISIIEKLQKRGVSCTLITREDPCDLTPHEKKPILDYLNNLSAVYSHFKVQYMANLHAKTLLYDDFICEGSFNWLSAVDDLDHRANKCEFSIGMQGALATPIIESFNQSEIGQKIGHSSHVIPNDFLKEIRIFSGANMNRDGYCVRHTQKGYLKNFSSTIEYFKTEALAQKAAYDAWGDKPKALPIVATVSPQITMNKNSTPAPSFGNTWKKESNQNTEPSYKRKKPFKNQSGSYYPKKAKYNSYQAPKEEYKPPFKILSGASVGKMGFCVRLDGDYLRNEKNVIQYFATEKIAQQEAHDSLSHVQKYGQESEYQY